jgi:hypothetical protein
MASAAPVASPEMDKMVNDVIGLAANLRASRSRPAVRPGEPHLFRISDFPEPSAEYEAARGALRQIADQIAEIGGVELMVDVYDEVVERHGYHAAAGVSGAWNGLHGWWH